MVSQSQSTSLSETVEYPTQLDPDAPAALLFRLFAELLRTSAFPYGKQQLDRVTIDDQEKAGISQEVFVPVLMLHQQPLQSRAIRQASKQGVIISDRTNDKRRGSALLSGRRASRS
jgi:hypothetical protein